MLARLLAHCYPIPVISVATRQFDLESVSILVNKAGVKQFSLWPEEAQFQRDIYIYILAHAAHTGRHRAGRCGFGVRICRAAVEFAGYVSNKALAFFTLQSARMLALVPEMARPAPRRHRCNGRHPAAPVAVPGR